MVSGSFSLPCSGFFSPFPHGTGSLSVSWEYLALPGGPGRFRQGFLVSRPTQDTAILRHVYLYKPFTFYGNVFQRIPIRCRSNFAVLQPRICRNKYGLGCFPFARRYLGNRCFFLFLLLLRCFSSEGWPTSRCDSLLPAGLSHSEISGSNPVCKSPELIAAYHVFLRLQEPRHPPYALIYFLTTFLKIPSSC